MLGILVADAREINDLVMRGFQVES